MHEKSFYNNFVTSSLNTIKKRKEIIAVSNEISEKYTTITTTNFEIRNTQTKFFAMNYSYLKLINF